MNINRKFSIATILLLLYLFLPATNFAHAVASEGGRSIMPAFVPSDASPGDDCPCSGDQGSGCCDTTSCNCECHAPFAEHFQLNYSPVVFIHSYSEPGWKVSQVDLPIFVPPQNMD